MRLLRPDRGAGRCADAPEYARTGPPESRIDQRSIRGRAHGRRVALAMPGSELCSRSYVAMLAERASVQVRYRGLIAPRRTPLRGQRPAIRQLRHQASSPRLPGPRNRPAASFRTVGRSRRSGGTAGHAGVGIVVDDACRMVADEVVVGPTPLKRAAWCWLHSSSTACSPISSRRNTGGSRIGTTSPFPARW